MKVIYEDGGELDCSKIVIAGDKIHADDIYEVSITDVKEITE